MNGRPTWRTWLPMAAVFLLTIPAIALRFGQFSDEPAVAASLFGIGILGAAFLLAWGAEVAQIDISRSLAVAFLALIAVLPEYAVDFVFAWKAADDPTFAHYAAANMTGANRLLIGIGWSMVVLLFWVRTRKSVVRLEKRQAIEVTFLLLATVWAFTIFVRALFTDGSLNLVDTVVLVSLFIAYLAVSSLGKDSEAAELLVGPPAAMARLGTRRRRAATLALFLFSAFVIFISAEPFAHNLVTSGKELGIDEFLLVQWVAPLASEAPEILVALIFTLRGMPTVALAALVSSKVNQWTLLVGTLPVVYSVSLGSPAGLPLDTRQVDEFFLTAAQSLFGVVVLVSLSLSVKEALALFALFVTQLFFTDPQVRVVYALVYLGLTVLLLAVNVRQRRAVGILFPRAKRELDRLRHPEGRIRHG